MRKTNDILAPFRGIRYNTALLRDISAFISPPYDIISPALQEELYAKHEHNFVRVELSKSADTDTDRENRYTRAADTLRQWQEEGVLIRDRLPALYVIETEFRIGGETYQRRGVFAAVRIPEADESYVLAHEDTFTEAKADRYHLMTATHAMISPVMSLYADADGELKRLLYGIDTLPEVHATEQDGVVHRMWVVRDEFTVFALCRAVGAGPLYIADGHHRFETARAYREEMRLRHPDAPPDAAFNYALMLIVSARDLAVRILPTHRVVSGLGMEGVAWLQTRIQEYCEVEAKPRPEWARIAEWLRGEYPPDRHIYGVYNSEGRFEVITVRESLHPASDSPIERLDVTVLHDLLLNPLMVCEATEPSSAPTESCPGPRVSYVVDPQEAAAYVARGESEYAFFLQDPTVDQVIAVARAGERMPKKSTYFFPKAAAGFVISDASPEPR